jgi:hypothetical protein
MVTNYGLLATKFWSVLCPVTLRSGRSTDPAIGRSKRRASMVDPAVETYEALDASAHVSDRGSRGTITLLTRTGSIGISMKRPIMEQLYHRIERELSENPIPSAENREIS